MNFKDKIILITGGTGSFGNQIAKRLVNSNAKEIRILSRHENLQFEMKKKYPSFKYIIGDVRDIQRVNEAMDNVDIVFHAAALKQVPDCERHPLEAIKTNVLGAHNVKQAAILNDVTKLVFISTDKAVEPINAMGMTKALQEKIFLNNEFGSNTDIVGVRYGNILCSRGSVVPYFVDLAKRKRILPVTHLNMTRFLLTLDDAIDLVYYALRKGKNGELFVKKSPSANIVGIAAIIGKKYGVGWCLSDIRPGEKIHETLVSEEEMLRAKSTKTHYIIGKKQINKPSPRYPSEYTSYNTRRFTILELKKLLGGYI